jgi:hypothetical protein
MMIIEIGGKQDAVVFSGTYPRQPFLAGVHVGITGMISA